MLCASNANFIAAVISGGLFSDYGVWFRIVFLVVCKMHSKQAEELRNSGALYQVENHANFKLIFFNQHHIYNIKG